MDPITLNKLLSVADAIDLQKRSNSILLEEFHRIVYSQGRLKRPKRRVQDILRIFRAAHWIEPSCREGNRLLLTRDFNDLIDGWNSGHHLSPMNKGLRKYPPYAKFLDCLEKETQIKVPRQKDKGGVSLKLREQYGINLVAFGTFRAWAVSVGHAYLSPLDRTLYWGGNWDAERPTVEDFLRSCLEGYSQSEKTSGFANLGHVAHKVCIDLGISFQAFEMKINQFVDIFPEELRLSPATIRRELSGHFKITSVRPRLEVSKERLEAKLRGEEPPLIQWLEHRYLEDGVRIKSKLIKLMKWEVSNVN